MAATGVAPPPAFAAPTLHADITWRGECDNSADLAEQVRSRGAEVKPPAADSRAVVLSVAVRRVDDRLVADIELIAPTGQQRRSVEARECVALRRAVAWVMGVLAEEREAAAPPSTGEANDEFPVTPVPPAPETRTVVPPQPAVAPPRAASPPPPRATPCAHPSPRFQLDTSFVAAMGLVDSVAVGPTWHVRYRPCARFWPGFTLGAIHLMTLGYDLDARSISLQRTSGQLGVSLPFVFPELRLELMAELGRIRASGSATDAGPGGSGSAPWFAFVVPLRLSIPLVGQFVTAELDAGLAYTPLAYRLRYESAAAPLARPSHFELRGGVGIAGHF